MKNRRTLEEVLQSASEVLFPAEMGEAVVTVMTRDVCGDTPLHVMAWRSDRHAVMLLIEAGAELDAQGDMGETPLHVAIRRGDTAIAEILLDAGAATDLRSEFNETALEAAENAGGDIRTLLRRRAARQAAAGERARPVR